MALNNKEQERLLALNEMLAGRVTGQAAGDAGLGQGGLLRNARPEEGHQPFPVMGHIWLGCETDNN